MSSHYITSQNFSHAHYKNKDGMFNIDRELKMGELRLRYVQLMRDAQMSLGDQDANILIKESEAIWYKLRNSKSVEN
tara:strand:+ start:637 stop:867 length:231 start_codon:yes stop_codon:yes gene_type:complete